MKRVLTKRELERYSRQIVFPKLGMEGQERLKGGGVAILGLGGLGCAAATYLARAGVGRISLIDRDFVEMDNIQRQILYDERDAKAHIPKAVVAKEKLAKMNSDIILEAAAEDFNPKTAGRLVKGADIVVDGTDNLKTRYLLNEVCVRLGKPFVHGAAVGDVGVVTTIIPGKTPCFKCIFPETENRGSCMSRSCETGGVIGLVPGLIGMLEAMEAMKFLSGFGELLTSKLLYFRMSPMRFDIVNVRKNADCDVCSKK